MNAAAVCPNDFGPAFFLALVFWLLVFTLRGMIRSWFGWPFSRKWRALQIRRRAIYRRECELIERGFEPGTAAKAAEIEVVNDALKTTELLKREHLE